MSKVNESQVFSNFNFLRPFGHDSMLKKINTIGSNLYSVDKINGSKNRGHRENLEKSENSANFGKVKEF